MQQLEFLVGNESILNNMKDVPVLPVFSESIISFLNDLSGMLRKHPEAKNYQDILSYSFWIRKSSLLKEAENHIHLECRVGRGVAFHIAPSNVPVNFAVSMTSAMLAGNACIIRVSNKWFRQVDIICDAMNQLLSQNYPDLAKYFCIVRYEHDEEITQHLSDMCDIRIIWGGNQTIQLIRRAALPPRAIEMAFADRYSIVVIDADVYLTQNLEKVARDFYTDTYYSDQNACSSPRLVVWLGDQKEKAREHFWKQLEEMAENEYSLRGIQAVDKLDAFCRISAEQDNIGIQGQWKNNYLYRVKVQKPDAVMMNYKEAGGYFFEYDAETLDEIVPILGKTCQTVAVLGVDINDVRQLVQKSGVRGVDRIVPMGKTMELSFRWDGFDMIETMSRLIV